MESRRRFLKKMVALGALAPLAGALGPTVAAARGGPLYSADSAGVQAGTANWAAGLTNEQMAGQRVIFSYPGLTVPQSLLDQIKAGKAAGVCFFGENISGDSQIAGVINQLKAAQAQSPVNLPLILTTDQEGGLVRRLPGAPEMSEKQIGESADPKGAASQAGTAAGQNLSGVGMNVNLAPVLGVYRQAGDFLDQYQRSYSQNAATVAVCAGAFISAQQQTGVAAVAKHFPGLGAASASQNTDNVPVTLNVPLSDLRSIDEAPYSVITNSVELIMTSWAIYPALDPNYPAGLSRTIIQNELRGRLGFKGVTMTDALEAGALMAFGNTGQRAVSAALAGMDLILCSSRDVGQGQEAVTAIANALGSGQLDQNDFNTSLRRLDSLRTWLNGGPPSSPGRYFPETGHSIANGFLAYWNNFGGLASFGYPLTDEFSENGVTMQYFERVRFEWHPGSDPAHYDVLLGLLGDELTAGERNTPPFQPQNPANNGSSVYFSPTKHNLSFGFRAYWEKFGGLSIFGYPISEEYQVNGLTIQWFERARFEWHPGAFPQRYDVLLGRLGAEVLAMKS